MMEAVYTSETSVYFNETTAFCIPEDCHLHEACDLNFPFVFCTRPVAISPVTSWLYSSSQLPLYLAAGSGQGLVTVDAGGCVRLWETSLFSLEKSLMEWKQMIGSGM
jgi:hypothetical protein